MRGFVVPIGKPRYVKGRVPTVHPKVLAKHYILSGDTLMGIIWDFL
jgi:hypothetical protein